MGEAARAMQARLAESGLEVSLDSNEPPDHIALEFEYLYHLLATAWSEDNPSLEAAGREFAGQTMLPWVRRFRAAVLGGDPHPVYACASELAVTILKQVAG